MSKAKLKLALRSFFNEHYATVTLDDAEEMLNTEVELDGKITNVAKIARKEDFNGEETAALYLLVSEDCDVKCAIEIVENGDYCIHLDAEDNETLGQAVFWQLERKCKLPSFFTEDCINFENLGIEYSAGFNHAYFTDYGFIGAC